MNGTGSNVKVANVGLIQNMKAKAPTNVSVISSNASGKRCAVDPTSRRSEVMRLSTSPVLVLSKNAKGSRWMCAKKSPRMAASIRKPSHCPQIVPHQSNAAAPTASPAKASAASPVALKSPSGR